jgi:transposase
MTLLRLVHTLPLAEVPTPRVLGVDDWARQRGRTYGTIVVDQERHRVIDLLPDRTAETLATWLATQTGVEAVCRDRAGAYADGVRQGAPMAVQVADRFHILVNLREAIERLLTRKHLAVRAAAEELATPPSEASTSPTRLATAAAPTPFTGQRLTRAQREQRDRRAQRQARYEAVRALHNHGVSARQIARRLDLARGTVDRFLCAEGFPELQARRPRPTLLTHYTAYLRERWDAGCHNATALWREVCARGFTGKLSTFRYHLAHWRTAAHRAVPSSVVPAVRSVSVRQATWLLLEAPAKLEPSERAYVEVLCQRCPEAERARPLAQAFAALVRARDLAALAPWIEQAEHSGVPELRGFATGLRRDWAAVEAALCLPWSNGQTEGQITKLKLLKRSMYGRGSLALLTRRLVLAS